MPVILWCGICVVPNLLNTEIVALKLAQKVDTCLQFFMLCSPVQAEAMCYSSLLFKESYHMSKRVQPQKYLSI
jgi:hypothetical protein